MWRGLPDKMKKIPETKARMVRWGRMWPMLLMTKAVKTNRNETMGKGVAVLTISNIANKSEFYYSIYFFLQNTIINSVLIIQNL